MKTVKLTIEHVGRRVQTFSDGRSYQGTLTKLDEDGGFTVYVPDEGSWHYNSLNKVYEPESADDKGTHSHRIVLIPTDKERRAMEFRGFLAFLSNNGTFLARRREDDPLNPEALSLSEVKKLLKTYLAE